MSDIDVWNDFYVSNRDKIFDGVRRGLKIKEVLSGFYEKGLIPDVSEVKKSLNYKITDRISPFRNDSILKPYEEIDLKITQIKSGKHKGHLIYHQEPVTNAPLIDEDKESVIITWHGMDKEDYTLDDVLRPDLHTSIKRPELHASIKAKLIDKHEKLAFKEWHEGNYNKAIELFERLNFVIHNSTNNDSVKSTSNFYRQEIIEIAEEMMAPELIIDYDTGKITTIKKSDYLIANGKMILREMNHLREYKNEYKGIRICMPDVWSISSINNKNPFFMYLATQNYDLIDLDDNKIVFDYEPFLINDFISFLKLMNLNPDLTLTGFINKLPQSLSNRIVYDYIYYNIDKNDELSNDFKSRLNKLGPDCINSINYCLQVDIDYGLLIDFYNNSNNQVEKDVLKKIYLLSKKNIGNLVKDGRNDSLVNDLINDFKLPNGDFNLIL